MAQMGLFCIAGPMHHEPPQYDSYRPPGPFYGGQPPPRRWAAGPSSRFGGRAERRSPPPHWTGPVNPTTGSPIHERPVAVEGPRERAMGAWDPAAPPQRGSSQWGTSSGWERIGQDARTVSPGAVRMLFTCWHVRGLARRHVNAAVCPLTLCSAGVSSSTLL